MIRGVSRVHVLSNQGLEAARFTEDPGVNHVSRHYDCLSNSFSRFGCGVHTVQHLWESRSGVVAMPRSGTVFGPFLTLPRPDLTGVRLGIRVGASVGSGVRSFT